MKNYIFFSVLMLLIKSEKANELVFLFTHHLNDVTTLQKH